MKKLIALTVAALALTISATAFAEPPACAPNTTRDTVCRTANGKDVRSCGDGTFLFPAGSPVSACDASWSATYDADGNAILKKKTAKTLQERAQ